MNTVIRINLTALCLPVMLFGMNYPCTQECLNYNLWASIKLENFKAIIKCVKQGAQVNAIKYKPLLEASYSHNVHIMDFLLNQGANPLIQDESTGNTPLHIITQSSDSNDCAIGELLLNQGANPLQKNYYQNSPLKNAAYYGNVPMVSLLLKFIPAGQNKAAIREIIAYIEKQSRTARYAHLTDKRWARILTMLKKYDNKH